MLMWRVWQSTAMYRKTMSPPLWLRSGLGAEVSVLGPAPAPIAFVRNRHRHHVLVKAPPEAEAAFGRARTLLAELVAKTARPRAFVDVDPASLL